MQSMQAPISLPDASARTYPKRKRRVSCVTVSFSMSEQVLNVRGSRNDGGASPASRPLSSPAVAGCGPIAGKLPCVEWDDPSIEPMD